MSIAAKRALRRKKTTRMLVVRGLLGIRGSGVVEGNAQAGDAGAPMGLLLTLTYAGE